MTACVHLVRSVCFGAECPLMGPIPNLLLELFRETPLSRKYLRMFALGLNSILLRDPGTSEILIPWLGQELGLPATLCVWRKAVSQLILFSSVISLLTLLGLLCQFFPFLFSFFKTESLVAQAGPELSVPLPPPLRTGKIGTHNRSLFMLCWGLNSGPHHAREILG